MPVSRRYQDRRLSPGVPAACCPPDHACCDLPLGNWRGSCLAGLVRYPLFLCLQEKRMHVMSPRPPWLAALPNHPARRLVRRIILGCWIGIPVLPLLAFPFVQPPGLVVLLSLLLAALSAIMYLAVGVPTETARHAPAILSPLLLGHAHRRPGVPGMPVYRQCYPNTRVILLSTPGHSDGQPAQWVDGYWERCCQRRWGPILCLPYCVVLHRRLCGDGDPGSALCGAYAHRAVF